MKYKRPDIVRKRLRAKFDINCFIRIKYDKILNRVNGYGKSYYKGLTILNRDDFYIWSLNSGKLFVLYHKWIKGGYSLKLMPTIDRIDSNNGYNLNNIRWISQSENSSLGGSNK